MTTPRNPSARCDAVLALIDACLAEVGPGRSGRGSPPKTSRPVLARRHLTLISG
jgi:hypothetical protein